MGEVRVTSKMALTEAQRNERALRIWRAAILSMSCFGGLTGDKVYGVVRGQVTKDLVCHTKEFLSCRAT